LSILIAILSVLLVAVVVVVVSAPLRSSGRWPGSGSPGGRADEEDSKAASDGAATGAWPAPAPSRTRGDLEAAREAKYREIRDAELDYRTGKLSREDYDAIDAGLRAEAIEILNRLEADREG
jgi:hypothetical protein